MSESTLWNIFWFVVPFIVAFLCGVGVARICGRRKGGTGSRPKRGETVADRNKRWDEKDSWGYISKKHQRKCEELGKK